MSSLHYLCFPFSDTHTMQLLVHKDCSFPRKFTKLRKKVALLKTVLCLSALPFQMLSQHFMLSVKVLQDNLSSKKYRKITVAK